MCFDTTPLLIIIINVPLQLSCIANMKHAILTLTFAAFSYVLLVTAARIFIWMIVASPSIYAQIYIAIIICWNIVRMTCVFAFSNIMLNKTCFLEEIKLQIYFIQIYTS